MPFIDHGKVRQAGWYFLEIGRPPRSEGVTKREGESVDSPLVLALNAGSTLSERAADRVAR